MKSCLLANSEIREHWAQGLGEKEKRKQYDNGRWQHPAMLHRGRLFAIVQV